MATEETNAAVLGKRIREAREKAGLNQAELARGMGVLPTHLNRWEKGKVAPGWEYLARIAKHCNVTLDWLLTGKEPAAVMDTGGAEGREEAPGVPFDAEQLKEVVMAVEEFLHEVGKGLSPRDKAALIARLYTVAVRGLTEEPEEDAAAARSRMTARMAAELARYGI
jgi:transcriptional regulator with XRE-family HTH domain